MFDAAHHSSPIPKIPRPTISPNAAGLNTFLPFNFIKNLDSIAIIDASTAANIAVFNGAMLPIINPVIIAENGNFICFFRYNLTIKYSVIIDTKIVANSEYGTILSK